jgi:hypothetical protein
MQGWQGNYWPLKVDESNIQAFFLFGICGEDSQIVDCLKADFVCIASLAIPVVIIHLIQD